MAEIAGDVQEDEALRDVALDHLDQLGALEELSRLASILGEPPAVTWALHIGWLETARRHRLTVPPLGHLREVDNVPMQEALSFFA